MRKYAGMAWVLIVLIALGVAMVAVALSGGPTSAGATSPPPENTVQVHSDHIPDGVTIIVDEDRSVVCYVYRDDANNQGVGAGGISCLPMDEVRMGGLADE